MKRLLVIQHNSQQPNSQQQIQAYFEDKATITFVDYDKLLFILDQNSYKVLAHNLDISSFDLIYFKFYHHILYQSLLALNPKLPIARTVNQALVINKLYQYCCLARENLSFPCTISSRDKQVILQWVSDLHFPVVVKPWKGSFGEKTVLIQSMVELEKYVNRKSFTDNFYLFQKYVDNDFDLRILVVKSQVKAAFKRLRTSQTEWRNNLSQGGVGISLGGEQLPPGVEALAIKAVKAVGYQVAGVDVVLDKITNQPYVLEVNASPGFYPSVKKALLVYMAKLLDNRAL
ncbi:ATP-grasp domain-containing protein [Candidatus Beckwithbacteria bacterium]|nr:ATP-grasp domain-containing protein [Candidatus Beckwithbacteria bacterium]